jgi:hypothetical protein
MRTSLSGSFDAKSVCTACRAGYETKTYNAAKCSSCAAGQFSSAASLCSPCIAGTFAGAAGQAKCHTCPSGRWSKTGAKQCDQCVAGKFSAASACVNCPAGKFGTKIGATFCEMCVMGKFQSNTGKQLCHECTVGKTAIAKGAAKCTDCAAGKWSLLMGRSSDCVHCPAGKYQTATGSTTCALCRSGKYGNKGQTGNPSEAHCNHCKPGTFQHYTGKTVCDLCPANKFTPKAADRAAHKGNGHHNDKCISCEVRRVDKFRFYWTNGKAGQSECTKRPVSCSRGTFTAPWTTCTKSCRTKIYYAKNSKSAHWADATLTGSQIRYQNPTHSWGSFGNGLSCGQTGTYHQDAGREYNQWQSKLNQWVIRRKCNQHACPVDCKVSGWTAYGSCSHSCKSKSGAQGTKFRTRIITIGNTALMSGHHGGKACPPLKTIIKCNSHACPIDCVVSPWARYGACTKTCNNGKRRRYRTIATPVQYGGKACPTLAQEIVCGAKKCGVDCKRMTFSKLMTIPNGWQGAGVGQEGYCNLCRCHFGEYTCTKRKCGPQYGQTCKRMTCAYKMNKLSKTPVMVINHHHLDTSTRHKCGFNLATGKCVCQCL